MADEDDNRRRDPCDIPSIAVEHLSVAMVEKTSPSFTVPAQRIRETHAHTLRGPSFHFEIFGMNAPHEPDVTSHGRLQLVQGDPVIIHETRERLDPRVSVCIR